MVNLIRRFQQPLMIFITVIIIIAFAWLYNDNRFMDRMGADRVGAIYGQHITQAQFFREARKYELARGLQLNGLIKALGNLPPQMPEEMLGMYQLPETVTEEFVWNSFVLRHEAARLGLAPTAAEIEDTIKNLPAFRTNEVYDSSKYNLFIANALAPRGLTPDALEDLVSDQLLLEKAKVLLGSSVASSPSELRSIFELRNTKLETSVLRWKLADFLKDQQVSDDELKKAFEERKATLMTEELRKVKFVAFTLPHSEKPLVGKERTDALRPLGAKAEDFEQAMTAKDAKFEDAAAKLEVQVQETPAFAAGQPPAEFGQEPAVSGAAFKLTKEQPNSGPVQTDKGYYILQLAEVIAAREQTLDEAKVKLAEVLKNERATEAMNLKATEVRNKIDAELKAGKSFAEASAAAGVKAETFPPFSLSEPSGKDPDGRDIMMAASELEAGQLSGIQTAGAGSLLVFLDKKQPLDEAKFAQEKPLLTEQIARAKRDGVFVQWFKQRRTEANVQVAHGRS